MLVQCQHGMMHTFYGQKCHLDEIAKMVFSVLQCYTDW